MNKLIYIILPLTFLVACDSSQSEDKKIPAGSIETNNAAVSQSPVLEVYCFHGTRQCETCKNMKAYTKATLDQHFAAQLKDSSIRFSIIDVDDEKNEKLAEKFEATGTALMINHIVNGRDSILDWSDFAFDEAGDKEKYIAGLKLKIDAILK